MSEYMLDFQCPHCRANHHLPVEFAGNRQPCSECGKTMRLPSIVGNVAASPMDTSVNQTQGGSVMVTCPLCSKTLYASQQHIGQEILCETCLESVPVPTPDKQNKTNKAKSVFVVRARSARQACIRASPTPVRVPFTGSTASKKATSACSSGSGRGLRHSGRGGHTASLAVAE